MKIYIYTIPKAGTYFLADFIGRLGFHNTGFHVDRNQVLKTHKLDLETNARFPSRAMEKQFFVKTLREMKEGDVAFGHFALPLMPFVFPNFFFVCAYRHPRKTLVSEFVDFRFRREDIPWITHREIEDDREAFCHYLKNHGPIHMGAFSQMIAVSLLVNEPLCTKFTADHFHMVNFDRLLKDPNEAVSLAEHLGADPAKAKAALDQTKQAETKTKATDIDVDRDALWSDRAEELYQALEPEAYVQRGRELGWDM